MRTLNYQPDHEVASNSLRELIGDFERRLADRGRWFAFCSGVGVALAFGLVEFVIGNGVGFALSFFSYFPFHAWLTISLFLVLFSSFERSRLIAGSHGPLSGFVVRLFSPFGVFCLGWFYSMMAFGFGFGVFE